MWHPSIPALPALVKPLERIPMFTYTDSAKDMTSTTTHPIQGIEDIDKVTITKDGIFVKVAPGVTPPQRPNRHQRRMEAALNRR